MVCELYFDKVVILKNKVNLPFFTGDCKENCLFKLLLLSRKKSSFPQNLYPQSSPLIYKKIPTICWEKNKDLSRKISKIYEWAVHKREI